MPYSFHEAHARARQRKSPWNLLLIPLCFGSWFSITALLGIAALKLQSFLFPQDAFFAGYATASGFLIFLPSLFWSLPLGFMLGNCIAWLIPPARQAFESEAEKVQGFQGAGFKSTQKVLWKCARICSVICLPFIALGVSNFFALTRGGIVYHPVFAMHSSLHPWEEVQAIETERSEGSRGGFRFILELKDGTKIDILRDHYKGFIRAYPLLVHCLAGKNYTFHFTEHNQRLTPLWKAVLTQPPSEQVSQVAIDSLPRWGWTMDDLFYSPSYSH